MEKKLLLLVGMILLSLMAKAVDIEYDGICYTVVKKAKLATVIGKDGGYSGIINIPSTFVFEGTQYNVTEVAAGAFHQCDGLTAVTVPNSVKSIGDGTFSDSRNLATVSLGTGLTSLGNDVFYCCSSLNSIKIPEGVTVIGGRCFNECSSLASVTFPTTLQEIGSGAFVGCTKLSTITMPKGFKTLGDMAFIRCSSLTTVNLNNEMTYLGNSAFSDCCALESINLPTGITKLGVYTFSNCTSLTSITIPDNVTSIDWYCFSSCTGLKEVVVGNGVTHIDSNVFEYCSNLVTLTLGKNVSSIGSRSFANLEALEDVYCYAKYPPEVADNLFENSYPEYINLHVPYRRSSFYASANVWKEMIITEMDNDSPNIVFADAHVKELCIANWDADRDGELSEAEAADVQILNGVFTGNNTIKSFDELRHFTEIVKIGDEEFKNCDQLTSLTLPVSVESIGREAFASCLALESIYIPELVSDIGSKAFFMCYNMKSMEVSEDNSLMDSRNNCNAIVRKYDNILLFGCNNTIIPDDITQIEHHAFYGMNLINDIILPDGLTVIGDSAFMCCRGLTSITIPKTVTWVGYEALRECRDLASIVVDEDNQNYDSRDNCNALIGKGYHELWVGCKNTVIPESVKTIVSRAFYACQGLTSVNLPENLNSIGKEAFYGCEDLVAIDFPKDLKTIEESAFERCVSLTSLEFPEYLYDLGSNVFKDCTGLASVVFPKNTSKWGDNTFVGCTSLAKVSLLNREPPVNLESDPLPTRNEIILYVPFTCSGIYSEADYWKEFKDILELDNTSPNIEFEDEEVKNVCISNWDIDHDGAFSEDEASIVTSLGDAFRGNKKITKFNELYYFTVLSSIGKYAFYGCENLTEVFIPTTITTIGDSAFYDCSALSNIDIPYSVSSIGNEAFYGCRGLPSLYIPYNVMYIGHAAFAGCTGLNSITVTDANMAYESRNNAIIEKDTKTIIAGCSETYGDFYSYGIEAIGDGAFFGVDFTDRIGISLPYELKKIGNNAFEGCRGITSLFIPSNVTFIGENAFRNCADLTSISVDESNTVFDSRQSCEAIIETESNNLIVGCRNSIIPEDVESIGDWAFSSVSEMTSVTLPSAITSVGVSAFSGCTGLTSVTLMSDTPIVIDILADPFPTRSDLTLYVPYNTKSSYQEMDYWKDFKEIVEMEVVYYGYAVFDSETGTLTFKYGVKPAGNNVFVTDNTKFDPDNPVPWDCANLKTVVFDPSFADARPFSTACWFYNAESLTSITGLQYLNTSKTNEMCYMFYGCSSLTILDLSSFDNSRTPDITKMFANCQNLKTIYVGQKCECFQIGNAVFEGCNSLVGGKGTVFDASHIDWLYAHIDGGPTNPGYFTSHIEGDINGDGELDVLDIVDMTNYMRDTQPDDLNNPSVDMNGDKLINIADIIQIVNQILSEE